EHSSSVVAASGIVEWDGGNAGDACWVQGAGGGRGAHSQLHLTFIQTSRLPSSFPSAWIGPENRPRRSVPGRARNNLACQPVTDRTTHLSISCLVLRRLSILVRPPLSSQDNGMVTRTIMEMA